MTGPRRVRPASPVPRILHLTPGCFDQGGISRYSRYQISALQEIMGPGNVRALSLLGPDGNGFETPFQTHWHGRGGPANERARAAFALRALREVFVWRPQIIHAAHVNFAPLASRLGRICRARTVLNVYGLEVWSGLSPRRAAHMACMDGIIADCHATADYVAQAALHPAQPVVIWDCADLARFRPGAPDPAVITKYGLPDPDRHRVVLTLGRLSKVAAHKGYDRLIAAFAAVVQSIPQARLVVAGRGDDRPRLEAIAAEHGVGDRVRFTGAIDEADLPALYRAAHVFSLVSDRGHGRGEGIPLTPIEAMASGLPVLVGDEDGSREAVDGSRNGLVVSPRDPAAMAEALCTLLVESGGAARRRAAEARAVAEERFGYAAFIEKHRAFYAVLAAQRAAFSLAAA